MIHIERYLPLSIICFRHQTGGLIRISCSLHFGLIANIAEIKMQLHHVMVTVKSSGACATPTPQITNWPNLRNRFLWSQMSKLTQNLLNETGSEGEMGEKDQNKNYL
jgi:hypothetical protein